MSNKTTIARMIRVHNRHCIYKINVSGRGHSKSFRREKFMRRLAQSPDSIKAKYCQAICGAVLSQQPNKSYKVKFYCNDPVFFNELKKISNGS